MKMIRSFIEEHRQAVEELCLRYRVQRLDLFGSATGENFDPQRSDVDFLVSFLEGGSDIDHFLGLAEGLETLFGKPVDLVIERAIRNPYFRQTVEATRRTLYAHREQEAAV